MNGLMSYRRFGRARSLRSDRAEHAFGHCVATLFELLSDDSRFLRKAFLEQFTVNLTPTASAMRRNRVPLEEPCLCEWLLRE
ncbi:hypothetical protein DY000_02015854 [Brassica cretica]|uniref:Uncharacterized protein n=1 Tax=Brassica cretica TaxID=69181 RepID=A0ABQ7D422_BRACR|nr:hypothetical protein DY000_02015854 [Brassica cretica]